MPPSQLQLAPTPSDVALFQCEPATRGLLQLPTPVRRRLLTSLARGYLRVTSAFRSQRFVETAAKMVRGWDSHVLPTRFHIGPRKAGSTFLWDCIDVPRLFDAHVMCLGNAGGAAVESTGKLLPRMQPWDGSEEGRAALEDPEAATRKLAKAGEGTAKARKVKAYQGKPENARQAAGG